MSRPELPSGTVTFLFTDIEGSTRLLSEIGAAAYAEALAEHRRLLREAFAGHGGVEVDTQGDAFFVAFPTPDGALAAARDSQHALTGGPIRVRMGIHTGTPVLTAEGYVGPDVHRASRIAAAGHGGQVLVSAATAGLVDRGELHDLGHHRLKDLSAPERIYQLGAGEFGPLNTLYQTNLPVPATSFLGRARELTDLIDLVAREDVRLITLTGPGGTGKTRLALQAAGASADRFPGGIWWVPLAPLRDPTLVLATAAGVLGASGDLAENVGDRQLLLLLDNFEQVVAASGDVGGLMARCPNLKALVTSREVLLLPGEHVYPVPPLEAVDGEQLFVTRATAASPNFRADTAVAELCRRLDNLPLAIELAAARVRMLSPEQLLQRLAQRLDLLKGGRGVDDRQQTLRATIEWSHDLLTDEEQRLFGRLAVFRGGWRLEAAEAICDADMDVLQSLVDKSLVRVRNERFSMLETIREFANERVAASGEAEDIGRRHAQFFADLVHEAEEHVRTDDLDWLNRLEADQDNLRATLDFFDAHAEYESGLQMAASLWRFWYSKSHFTEGLARLTAAAEREQRTTPDRAKALRGASVMAMNLGDPDAGVDFAQRALELDRLLGDEWGIAYSLLMIGNSLSEVFDESRDLRLALDRLAESEARFEQLGDRQYALIAMHNRAWMVGDLGDREGEKRLHEQSLAIAREIGSSSIEADALAMLGMAARDEGRLDDAAAMLHEAIRIEHRRGAVFNLATDIGRLASVRLDQGQPFLAARLLGSEAGLLAQLGSKPFWWVTERRNEGEKLIAERIGHASLAEELAAGRALTVDEAVELALQGSPGAAGA